MQEKRYEHHTSISIGGRSICNLRFADDIDVTDRSNSERQDLTSILIDRATPYGMGVSPKKSKITANSMNNISADISINSQKLEKVTSFNT